MTSGVLRHSPRDALLVALAGGYGALLLIVPSAPVIALGIWWTANTVAHNFIQLQQHRHTADYDNLKNWSHSDVENVLTLATDAFIAWRAISTQDAAQDYLLQMFLPKLPAR